MIDSNSNTSIQLNQNSELLVEIGTEYCKNGVVVGYEVASSYTLKPGDSLDGHPPEVVKIANEVWQS